MALDVSECRYKMAAEINAVLFDSGGTLLRPIGRRVVASPNPAEDGLSTEEEEVAQFKEFYAIVLAELRIATDAPMIEELALAEIRELIQEPFPETRAVL